MTVSPASMARWKPSASWYGGPGSPSRKGRSGSPRSQRGAPRKRRRRHAGSRLLDHLPHFSTLHPDGGAQSQLRAGDRTNADPSGRGRGEKPRGGSGEIAGAVDGVCGADEQRRAGACGKAGGQRVGRPHGLLLPRVGDTQAERGAVAGEALDLRAEPADHDRHLLDPGRRELAQQRRDDRAPVDRQDRLRPALGQRPEPQAFAGREDHRLHDSVGPRAGRRGRIYPARPDE